MLTRRTAVLILLIPCCLTLLGLGGLQDAGEGTAPDTARTRFAGKTVVVTGANRGLGLEFAAQLMADGAKVVGTARAPERADELRATGARILQLDVTDDDSVAAFAEALGDAPVSLLINNAGTSGRHLDDDVSRAERARAVMDVNTLGPIRVTEALLPNLIAADGAIVVNVSSRLGSITENTGGSFSGYRESKAALNMYSRSLAAEQRDAGIHVIAVSPGWVRTDMGGPDADLAPEESIGGLLTVLEELEAEHSGKFLNHDGTELEW